MKNNQESQSLVVPNRYLHAQSTLNEDLISCPGSTRYSKWRYEDSGKGKPKLTQMKGTSPLKPWYKNAYSPYCSPYISYGTSKENLSEYQNISP